MVKPLLNIHCVEKPGCKYPSEVLLLMKDGTVQRFVYYAPVSPCVQKASDILLNSIHISIGYQYQPKRKNRIPRWQRRTR